jgi:hypothetical protein
MPMTILNGNYSYKLVAVKQGQMASTMVTHTSDNAYSLFSQLVKSDWSVMVLLNGTNITDKFAERYFKECESHE